MCGNALLEIRFKGDHLTVRGGGLTFSFGPVEEAPDILVPVGSSEAEGRSKMLVTEERRERLSKAEPEADSLAPGRPGRRGGESATNGNSSAVLYVELETCRLRGVVCVETERSREKAG